METKRSMKVEDYRDTGWEIDFKIIKLKNTTAWTIGDLLTVTQIEHAIDQGIDVTIKTRT